MQGVFTFTFQLFNMSVIISADVEVDIEEYLHIVSTKALINELKERELTKRELVELKSIISSDPVDNKDVFIASNLDEQLKLELFREIVDVFPFTELEKRLR